jgi:hypothetical protein
MTAIGSTSSVKSLVAQAEAALTRIKKEVVSSHDIIPRTELSAFDSQKVEEYYNRYGFRVVRYLQYNVVYGKAERACTAALNEVFKELKFPSSAFPIAITKFGVGSVGGDEPWRSRSSPPKSLCWLNTSDRVNESSGGWMCMVISLFRNFV